MDNTKTIEILKSMPMGVTSKLKVGENEYACKKLGCTMEQIRLHNAEADGFGEGYKAAIAKMKEWRNNEILKLEGLL